MKGTDYVLASFPFLDANRMAALGASYGGYMACWVCGHTDRFKAMVSRGRCAGLRHPICIGRRGLLARSELIEMNPWSPHYQCGALPLSYGSLTLDDGTGRRRPATSRHKSASGSGHPFFSHFSHSEPR